MANIIGSMGPAFYDGARSYPGRSAELAEYERIVLFANPNATNAEMNDQLEWSLRDNQEYHGLHIERRETCSDTLGNMQLLGQSLEATDIAAVAGGDGTKSYMFNAAIRAGIRNPFLPISTGNAINLGHMFNGRAAAEPLKILAHGRLASIQPYLFTSTHPESDKPSSSEYSFAYWDIGGIALAAEPFCDDEVREQLNKLGRVARFIQEAKLVKSALAEAQTAPPMNVNLRIDNGPAQNLQLREFGLVFGSEMAKGIRFRQSRFDNRAIMLQLANLHIPRVASEAVRQALGIANRLSGEETLQFRVETGDGQPFAKQNDGEAYKARRLPSGTTFTAQRAADSVTVLAIKAPAGNSQ